MMACLALLFLLQPIVTAGGSCVLRARLFGHACCCEEPASSGSAADSPKSCCSKHTQPDAPAQKPVPKHCGCKLSAPPPLLPPADDLRLPSILGEPAHFVAPTAASTAVLDEALAARTLDPHGGSAPPGFASTFHVHLAAGMARALSFERNLRS